MKVCSQCEFIYEDDQSLCDMDGAELVYDPAPRALNQGAAPESVTPAAGSRWKRRAATVVAGVVLGTVLVLVFQVFKLRTQEQLSMIAPENQNYSSPQANGSSAGLPNLDLELPVPLAPTVDAVPVPSPGASPEAPAPQSTNLPESSPKATTGDLTGSRAKANGDVASIVKPSVAGPSRSAASRAGEATRNRERAKTRQLEENHKDSGIGSFLKKTGRILKKPFKF